VLLGNDVRDLVTQWVVVLTGLAVFATITGAMADPVFAFPRNHCVMEVAKRRWL